MTRQKGGWAMKKVKGVKMMEAWSSFAPPAWFPPLRNSVERVALPSVQNAAKEVRESCFVR